MPTHNFRRGAECAKYSGSRGAYGKVATPNQYIVKSQKQDRAYRLIRISRKPYTWRIVSHSRDLSRSLQTGRMSYPQWLCKWALNELWYGRYDSCPVTLIPTTAHDKMRSGADLNGDKLRIYRVYLQIRRRRKADVWAQAVVPLCPTLNYSTIDLQYK